jgi:hypothetical protein
MSMLDKHVIRYLKTNGKTVEGVFTLLVDMIARERSPDYVEHLQSVMGVKDMLALSHAVVAS